MGYAKERAIKNILMSAMGNRHIPASRKRVRLFYGDIVTGRDWMEENDVTGFVGCSTGTEKLCLLLPRRTSTGGSAIMLSSIVRLMVDGIEKYGHPRYYMPELIVVPGPPVTVRLAGAGKYDYVARFDTDPAARRYIAFLKGERATK